VRVRDGQQFEAWACTQAVAHLDEPLANRHFGSLSDLEQVVTERCRVRNGDQLKPGTNFSWWPKLAKPA